MLDTMKGVAMQYKILTEEERNLLFSAYKQIISKHQESFHFFLNIEQFEKNDAQEDYVQISQEYRSEVEKQLRSVCEDAINLINDVLLPSVESNREKMIYLKLFYFIFFSFSFLLIFF